MLTVAKFAPGALSPGVVRCRRSPRGECPAGNPVDCAEFCIPSGTDCGSRGICVPAGHVDCGDGTCCPQGKFCRADGCHWLCWECFEFLFYSLSSCVTSSVQLPTCIHQALVNHTNCEKRIEGADRDGGCGDGLGECVWSNCAQYDYDVNCVDE